MLLLEVRAVGASCASRQRSRAQRPERHRATPYCRFRRSFPIPQRWR